MDIYQSGIDCTSKLRLFAAMYFGRDKSDILLIHSRFEQNENKLIAYTQIIYRNKSAEAEAVIPICARLHSLKTARESAAIRSLCIAAEKITGTALPLPWGTLCGVRPAKMAREMLDEGFSTEEIISQMTSVYFVDEMKAKLAVNVAVNEKPVLDRAKKGAVSIYVGIPFCKSRCSYCSFVSRELKMFAKYMKPFLFCLSLEISETAQMLDSLGLSVDSVYIGGGTPTTLSAHQIKELCDNIRLAFKLPPEAEFTLEAGRADTITYEKLAAAKNAGVNRVSINPQTMNDATLLRINRSHTAEEFIQAASLAKRAGFKNINMDLIAGLPGETSTDFARSIDGVLDLSPENVTIHTLSKKRSSDMGMVQIAASDAEEVNKMLDYGYRSLYSAGYEPYYMYRQKNTIGNMENTGWSKPGLESFYNINIMEEVKTIIALGGGGSTKIVSGDAVSRIFNFKNPDEYVERFDGIIRKKRETADVLRRSIHDI